ncbi:hypothetical protein D3C81_2255800 [compost metagenome]
MGNGGIMLIRMKPALLRRQSHCLNNALSPHAILINTTFATKSVTIIHFQF